MVRLRILRKGIFMNIFIVRHGETNENKKMLYYGALDIELNHIGKSQSEIVGIKLSDIKFDKVFLSERKRTHETANIILNYRDAECIVDKRLNESSFGVFEGMTYDNIRKTYPKECERWDEDWVNYCPPEGESYRNMFKRVCSFMEYIKSIEAENILIVTHSGVMRSILCYIMDENLNLFWKFGCKNGDIALIKYEYGNLYLDSIVHSIKN